MTDLSGAMYALATVMTVVAIVAIGLRFWARRIKRAALSWDDYAIVPALVFTIGTAICMFVGTARGSLGRHTGLREDGQPDLNHRTTVFEKVVFASQLTQTLAFGFTKLSVLLFYRRIFSGNVFNIAVWTMITMTCLWTVAFFLANLLQCVPVSTNWHGYGYTPENCFNTDAMYEAQAWSDVLTDLIIISLPPPCVWRLHMSIRYKAVVSGMFLLGLLTVGASIAKLVAVKHFVQVTDAYTNDTNIVILDISYLGTLLVYWAMIESSLGILGACLPMLKPIFTNTSRSTTGGGGGIGNSKNFVQLQAEGPASNENEIALE